MTMFSPKTKDAWHIYYQQLLFSLEMLLKKLAIAEYFTLRTEFLQWRNAEYLACRESLNEGRYTSATF